MAERAGMVVTDPKDPKNTQKLEERVKAAGA